MIRGYASKTSPHLAEKFTGKNLNMENSQQPTSVGPPAPSRSNDPDPDRTVFTWKGFISYNQVADGMLAKELEAGLEQEREWQPLWHMLVGRPGLWV